MSWEDSFEADQSASQPTVSGGWQSSFAPDTPSSPPDKMMQYFSDQPGTTYGNILPFKVNDKTGDTSLAWPEIARSPMRGLAELVAGSAGERRPATENPLDPMPGNISTDALGTLTMLSPNDAIAAAARKPSEAVKIVGDYMKMDKTDPSSLSSSMANNPNSVQTIGDISGPNLQTLVESRSQSPGSSMASAIDVLGQRNISQPSRIDDLIKNSIANPNYIEQRQQQLLVLGAKPVQEAYGNAYGFAPNISDDSINNMLDRLGGTSVGKRILSNAEDTAKLAGKSLYGPAVEGGKPPISTYGIDTIKQSADQIIRSSSAQGNFDKYTTQGKNLTDLINGIVSRADEINPLYAKARATYSNPASLINAGDLGYKDIWGASSVDAIREFNSLEGAQRDAALSGVARKLSENLKTQAGDKLTPTASNLPLEFTKNSKNLEILQKILPEDQYNNLTKGLTNEANMQTFSNKILTNSATARRLGAQEDFLARTKSSAESKVAPTANYFANLTIDKPGSWFGVTPAKVENWAQGVSAANRDRIGGEIANMMLNTDPLKNQQTLMAIQDYLKNSAKSGIGFPNFTSGYPRLAAQALPFSLAPQGRQ